MNLLAKILLAPVFLVAAIEGVYLVSEVKSRFVLQAAYDDLKRAVDVIEANGAVNQKASRESAVLEKSTRSENQKLKQQIDEREEWIRALETSRDRFRQDAIALEGVKRTLVIRGEPILDGAPRIESNPPQVRVNGKVERVAEGQGGLVQLSLGTDQGVTMNNTLYAYRTRPEPTYLGMIRIVEAFHNRSVGRLESGAGQLREGDLVSSDLGGR